MSRLADQRCTNHAVREAVARCPECRLYFCRECITEHDDRVLCTACLKKLTKSLEGRRRGFAGLLRVLQCAAGIVIAWFFFFLIGERLMQLSDSFHEGDVWQVPWLER
jgi:hypothetical protein